MSGSRNRPVQSTARKGKAVDGGTVERDFFFVPKPPRQDSLTQAFACTNGKIRSARALPRRFMQHLERLTEQMKAHYMQ
jgi:hypothetical protein